MVPVPPPVRAQRDSLYSSGFTASGGMQPYTFTIASGSLPQGLSLNTSTGAITGTPTAVGDVQFHRDGNRLYRGDGYDQRLPNFDQRHVRDHGHRVVPRYSRA